MFCFIASCYCFINAISFPLSEKCCRLYLGISLCSHCLSFSLGFFYPCDCFLSIFPLLDFPGYSLVRYSHSRVSWYLFLGSYCSQRGIRRSSSWEVNARLPSGEKEWGKLQLWMFPDIDFLWFSLHILTLPFAVLVPGARVWNFCGTISPRSKPSVFW